MKYQTYTKYKPSGIEWIGKIPVDWESRKLKNFLKYDIGGTPPTSRDDYFDGDNIWVTIADMNNKKEIIDSKTKISDEAILHSNVKKIPKGSLLYSFKLSVGLTAFAGVDLYTNEAIASFFKNDKSDLNFFKYVFQVGFENNGFENIYGAKLFNKDLISSAMVIVPGVDEQNKIADFLDRKTSQIDGLIKKDKRLIELLQERRIALINQAVTKGLDPKARLVDSGVDWIGEIPEGWEVRKLKSLSYVRRGASPRPIDDPIYFDDNGEYSWVRISDVTASDKYLKHTQVRLSLLGKSLSVPINPGEIFISIAGSVGKPIISKIKCCIHDGFVYFQRLKMSRDFLYYIFITGEPYKGLGKLGTQLNLNTETIGEIRLPIPPDEKQAAIVKHLEYRLIIHDKKTKKVLRRIRLLEEYKKSLIYNAVTGKIKV